MTDRSELQEGARYDPSEVEPRIADVWLASGLFHPEPAGDPSENYSIAIPLPNVTGVLHMGHALNNSIQDCLIRYHRMRGQRTKWILGTDHAGIATQIQVERRWLAEGSSREQLGREAFVERVWRWREDYGGQIIAQLKRLGASLDYHDERFTLDDGYARAVQHVFVDALREGLHLPRPLHGQLGSRGRGRRSPTSRSRTARSPTRSTTSTTRWTPARVR